jgi:hypothetical protein
MILAEEGTRVEGPVGDVLAVLFDVIAGTAEETMPKDEADTFAVMVIGRAYAALGMEGYITRQVS